MMADIDFDLISTDVLLEELSNRHDGLIFVGVKNPVDGKVILSEMEYKGGPYLALGLCEVARQVIGRDAFDVSGDDDD